MKEKEKFDDIIRSKFEGQEFSFSEENWEKAESSLDSGRKWKRVMWFSLMFLGGLIAGIAIMLPFVKTNDSGESKMVTQAVEQKREAAPVSAKEIKEENSVVKGENKPEAAQKPVEEKAVQKSVVENSTSSEKPEKTEKHNSAVSKNENLFVAASIMKKEEQKDKQEQKVSVNSETQLQNNSDSFSVTVDSKTGQVSATVPDNKKQEEKEKAEEKQNAVPEVQSQSIPASSILIGMNVKKDSINEKKITALQNKIDSLDKVIAFTFAKDRAKQKKDSSSAAQQATAAVPTSAPLLQSPASANIFSVDAGTYYNMGWKYGDTVEARGFNPVFGFGFTHLFSPHWSLSTGLQYGSIGHLKLSTKTYSTSTPDFGSNTVDSIIDTKWIHYAVIPVFVQYHFNNKNSIGFGGSVSYLVNTTSYFMTNTYADLKDPVQTKQRSYGYTKGFSQWNATLAVAYKRRISEKFSLSAEAHYGLMDIKDNTFFSKQKFERSIGIKLLLSYNLF